MLYVYFMEGNKKRERTTTYLTWQHKNKFCCKTYLISAHFETFSLFFFGLGWERELEEEAPEIHVPPSTDLGMYYAWGRRRKRRKR